MRFTSKTSRNGVNEQLFILGEIPGVLWTPEGAAGTRPLILLGHGGGQHKLAPAIVAGAVRLVTERGYAVAAADAPNHGDRPKDEKFLRLVAETRARVAAGDDAASAFDPVHTLLAEQSVPEWQSVVTELQDLDYVNTGPVGYRGMSLGCGLGMPFVAAEPRVRAAVLGLFGSPSLVQTASRIAVPVQFLVQWDDELVPRAASLAVFDALASPDKTLHANAGLHADVPEFEVDSSLEFFARHLG